MTSANLFGQVHPSSVFLIFLHTITGLQMPGDFFFPILAPIDTFTKSITSVVSPYCLLASLARFKFKKSLIVSVYCIHLNKIFFPSYLTSSVVEIYILMDGIKTKTITLHFRMKTKLRIYA